MKNPLNNNFQKRADNLYVATRLKIIKRELTFNYADGMEKLEEFLQEMLKGAGKSE
jgi:hypothetical protein